MPQKRKKLNNSDKKDEFDTSENHEYNDDVHFEEDGLQAHDSLKKVQSKLKVCQTEKQEYLDGWQRAKADLLNAKKDFERQKADYVTYAREGLLEELLPVIDSFEMAFANKESWEKVDQNWRVGVEYIYSQLMKVLTDNGVKVLDPVGEKFDPSHHTSVGSIQTDDQKLDHAIESVRQKGFELHGKVVRPPKVVIYTTEEK